MSLEAAQKMYLGAKVTGKVGSLAQEIDGFALCRPFCCRFSEACFIAN